MKVRLFAAALAVGLVGGIGTGFAGEGIPAIPAQPLTASAARGVVGQNYPAFGGEHRPVVSNRLASVVGQNYPTFDHPAQSASRYAATQVGRVTG